MCKKYLRAETIWGNTVNSIYVLTEITEILNIFVGLTMTCFSEKLLTVFPYIVSALEKFSPLNSFRTFMYCDLWPYVL